MLSNIINLRTRIKATSFKGRSGKEGICVTTFVDGEAIARKTFPASIGEEAALSAVRQSLIG